MKQVNGLNKANSTTSASSNFSTLTIKPLCFLIGEDHFVIKCADSLIKHNFEIIGIASPFSNVKEWGKANQIPVYKSIDDADDVLNEAHIDYLFSIVNSKIIPNQLLNKTHKLAINYHHSPLPTYAGVNAPSWAILNGEKTHGVTWHIISDVIDGGDILKQVHFEIEEDETALTLNYKCYQQALVAFNELLIDIKNNNVKPYQQDQTKRSYYGLNKKTPGNALIDWNATGEHIERHFRALYLGAYDNALAVLKINIHNSHYIVSELKISHLSSNTAPGTINEITSSFWRISTTTHDIILIQLMSLYGEECSLEDIATRNNLKMGDKLPSIALTNANSFESTCTELSKHDRFWIAKLTSFEPAEMPFIDQFILHDPSEYALVAEKPIPMELISHNTSDALLTTWLIYLYRIGNKKNLGVSLNYSGMKECHIFRNCFSNEIPFFLQFEDEFGFEQAFELVSHHHAIIKNKATFLKDIFYRYPALTGISPLIPISIIIDEENETITKELESNAIVILKISIPNKQLSWYVKKNPLEINCNLTNFVKKSAGHFDVLLTAIAHNPHQPIRNLPILTAHEEQTLLFDWNRTQAHYPKNKNISALLDECLPGYEHNIAIRLEDSSITYGDLNNRVNKLANYFVNTLQVKHHDAIIVYMPRGLEWIVSILAIMKVGAIYIPVVTTTPLKRLELIINDSKATIVLSQRKLIDGLNELSVNVKLIDIHAISQKLRTNDTITADFPPHFSAYILYTSGTTGVPKGVVIRHASLVNLVYEQIRQLHLDASSHVLQFSSIGFDASIWEIFSTFMVGATLCIPSEQTVLIGKALTKTINAFDITLATLPPSILQTIQPTEITPSLKTIVTAGESCSRELADIWVNHVNLINAYGPTETTVCATMGIVDKKAPINIGKPIANTCAYLLDEHHQLVPEGVIGELYIGGDALAVGYLNQPKLTHHYFIANPLLSTVHERLYRTRDLVRWLPEGKLEYIGRIDNQIKIRGLRIEPEAIEAQILHHNDITQCVVALQHSDKLEKCIVAYLVSDQKIDLHHLREYLREHLPHYMIPNFFIMLNELPLTINGKIDRKALPVPELKCDMNAHDYTPPSTSTEKKLCKIWSDILGIEKIGIHNDFFTIGGNSLLLSQLIITLREQFDFEMHFSIIFKHPTIEALAQVVSKKFKDVIDADYNSRFINDTLLEKDVVSLPQKIHSKKHTAVLLTGATGFLGSHLLKELYLNNKDMQIYCLTRAESDTHAKALINTALQKHSFDFSVDDRIIPLRGDMAAPQIGLSDDVMKSLANELDDIYHNGAFVHHLYTYEMLRAANVGGTLELLKLAGQSKHKKFHYVSTLSAMGNFTEENNHVIEDFLSINAKAPPENGYNQTKWVSEKLLAEAANRGFSVNIYRPGWILGNTSTSQISIENNHFLSLIKGCVQMGHAPDWDIELNILPVDFLSKMIINISRSNHYNNKVFNFSNRNKISWTSLISFLNDFGCTVKLINKVEWTEQLKQVGQENSLFNLLPLYIGEGNDMEHSFGQIKASNDANVCDAMGHFNDCYPILNKEILSNFLHFLKK